MRRFPFLASRYALALLLGVNFALLGISIYLGLKSANQMKEIVKEDFNQQQLVLAKHTASLLEQDIHFLKRELSTLNFSPSMQYVEPLSWANRMRATLASVREEGVVEIVRLTPDGNRAYQVDSRGVDQITTESFKDAPFLSWARQPEHKGQILVMPVSTQIPHYMGRLITVMAMPTYEMSVDDTHPHPSGAFAGVLAFYIDAHQLAKKFTQGIRSGKTGYAWIMDSKGLFLTHPERDFIGKNAFTVRKERMSAISFDAINQIQREKMLAGKEGWGAYISGWHGGMAGEIQKLMAYAPVQLEDRNLVQEGNPPTSWSVAVVAPSSEVEGVIHSVYVRQFYLQVIIGLVVLSGTIVMLNFRYEQQFSSSLEEEVNRQKEKLQKSEARYQGLVENAADLIYTVDGDGRLLSINRYAANLFAMARSAVKPAGLETLVEAAPHEFVGRTLHDIFNQKSADFHMEWLREVQETGKVRSKRHPVGIGDQEFWFSTSIVGIKDEQGQTFAYEIISRNITGRKAIEDRMINMEKLASIGTLAAGVAHEINNPIAVILGFAEHLLEQTESLPEIHETLQVIEDEGLRCKKIVENLLTFARSPETTETSADITGLLDKTLAVVKNTLLTKKIRLDTSLAPGLPRVKGDPQELQQVFINLINNAADAMKGGGILKVVTTSSPDGKRVAIEFIDTGSGIPRDAQPKIFDPFFTTKKTGEGTGLGLSMSYGIISKFGGNIIFTSYPAEEYPEKHGTTFTVYLPMISGLEAEAAGQEQPMPPSDANLY
ncbi:MAG: ATP-binding protein [Desulfobaccales bacterium]